ncbi:MAG: hypothetical protein OXU37_06615, partial [Thaumarchaeota archaeon]|nr:hypothetical protein [Nitrososphaerota archaeon]
MARRKKRGIAARSPEAEAAALFRRGEALMARGLKAEAEKVLARAAELAPAAHGAPAAGGTAARARTFSASAFSPLAI